MSSPARLISALTLGLLLTALASTPAQPILAPHALVALSGALPRDSLRGTVRYVREDGVDIITGVQLNLRLTHFTVPSTAMIRRGDAAVALDTLQPGDLVDIQYHATAEGRVAERIVVRPMGREGAR